VNNNDEMETAVREQSLIQQTHSSSYITSKIVSVSTDNISQIERIVFKMNEPAIQIPGYVSMFPF